ncbi:hypothetical protein DEU56DRAFT_909318 [Suillus clintonianus]|uniref:uncharacterized protein n=1 Tax=Suillus clintonianus TaxID=1904413 RepID=UPI001B872F8F|nr:uncharacterized protein DEU56DRAFT_909318 [Suillus clintonianus]KAG2147968.1 hypothetical protein DEU56DRAFT_909318 [Suillus clintonianus]
MSENTLKHPADYSPGSFQDDKHQRIDMQEGTNSCMDSGVSACMHCMYDEQGNACFHMDKYAYACSYVRCHDTSSDISSIDSKTKCLINQLNETIEWLQQELCLADQTRHDTKVEHNQQAKLDQNDIYITYFEVQLEYEKKGIIEYKHLVDREASEKQCLIFALDELERGA